MPIVIDFDVDIFRVLSSGPSTFSMLRDELHKLRRTKIKDTYLIKRLSKMRNLKTIESKKYADPESGKTMSLYCLLEGALEHLYQHHYDLDKVRYGYLPESRDVRHELAVTGVTRTLKKEASRIGYKLSIVDERTLREEANSKRRKGPLPDLFIVLVVESGYTERIERIYNIEVDMGTIKPQKIIEKIKRSRNKTIMICNRTERIEKLQAEFQKEYQEMTLQKEKVKKDNKIIQKDLIHAIIFGTLQDFSNNGLLSSNFQSILGNPRPIFAEEDAKVLKRQAGLLTPKSNG